MVSPWKRRSNQRWAWPSPAESNWMFQVPSSAMRAASAAVQGATASAENRSARRVLTLSNMAKRRHGGKGRFDEGKACVWHHGGMDLWTLSDLSTPWCVHVVATLRIADHIVAGNAEIGPLAAAAGADRDSLYRVLRHLVSKGLFVDT